MSFLAVLKVLLPCIVAASLLAAAIVGGLSIFAWLAFTRRPARHPVAIEAKLTEKGEMRREWLDEAWVEARVKSPAGYELAVHALQGDNGQLVIVHHGVRWNWLGALKYSWFFWKAGYSVVLFDSRGHGASGGGSPSFGVHESRDLAAIASWARSRFESKDGLVLLGVSLGAASILQFAAHEGAVAAIVADCSFSSADAELDFRLAYLRIPAFMRRVIAKAVDILCRRCDGFSIFEASPARASLATTAPILFIHGLEDELVPPSMSESMAAERRRLLPAAQTELLLFPGAGHGKSHRSDPAAYEKAVLGFVDSALRHTNCLD